jgi:hypothetical protein
MRLLALLLPVIVAACWQTIVGPEQPQATNALIRRASFDLACPADQLRVEPISGLCTTSSWSQCTKGVTGCGRRATYTYDPGQAGMGSTIPSWQVNNPVGPTPPPNAQP